mgnify:CR=1 FL=1
MIHLRALLLTLLCSSAVTAAPVDRQRLLNAAQDGANWLTHGRDWS